MTASKTRAEFEAWLKTVGYTGDPFGEAFNVWRAARKAALEEAAKVCEDMHEEDRPSDYAYAIRSLADRSPT